MVKWLIYSVLVAFCLPTYASKPVREVGIGLYVNDITAIQTQEEIINLDATIFLRWQSEKKPSSTEYYYGNEVDKVLGTLWWPYYKFIQTREESRASLKALTIKPDGQVDYSAVLHLKLETILNMHQFPFDKQIIRIGITSFGAMPYAIEYYLLHEHLGIDPLAHLDEWKMTQVKNKISSGKNAKYEVLIYYQRQAGFYFYKIFLPLMVIVFISYLVLWLPKQPAINRLSVIITSMLTIVAFQWAVSNEVPKVSYMTFFQALLLFSFIAIGSKAILIVWGECLSQDKAYRLMYWGRMIYPLVFLMGVGVITLLWFK